MYQLKSFSRHGDTVAFGVSSEGLHLLAKRQDYQESELILTKEHLPLDWKRVEIGRCARDVVNGEWVQADFLVIGLEGFQTSKEKTLFCLQGNFRAHSSAQQAANSEPEWMKLSFTLTVYSEDGKSGDTKAYSITLRRSEAAMIAEIFETYWL